MDYAFAYVKDHGITAEDAYPYTARDGTCKKDRQPVVKTISKYNDVPAGNCSSLADAI